MIEAVITVGTAALAGAILAATGYAKSYTTESFNIEKALYTMGTGTVLGGLASLSGMDVSQESFTVLLVGYVGVIVVVRNVIKAAVRSYNKVRSQRSGG